MKIFLKGLVVSGALFGATLAGADAASAMPVAPYDGAPAAATAPIETVGWRCGPGWHVNPWGRCVPNGGYYRPYAPVYRPYAPVYRRPYYGRPYGGPYYRHW